MITQNDTPPAWMSSSSSPRSEAIAGNYSDNPNTKIASGNYSDNPTKKKNKNNKSRSRSRSIKRSKSTSKKEIIAVDVVDGTSICPIYVSEQDTDSSEHAVRGDRKIDNTSNSNNNKESSSLSKIMAHRISNSVNVTIVCEHAVRGDRKIDSTNNNNNKESSSLSQMAHHRISNSVNVTIVTDDADDEKKEKKKRSVSLKKTIVKVATARKSRSKSRDTKKKNNKNKNKNSTTDNSMLLAEPLHIDVTAFPGDGVENGGDGEDPILEKELEEIALNGRRSGLISGTPEKEAYDIEHGKPRGWRMMSKTTDNNGKAKNKNKNKSKKSMMKSVKSKSSKNMNIKKETDELDRSWHGAETLAVDNTTQNNKYRQFLKN
eukprot:CAMPEP_0170769618 /NCGR_PEP_ID=MMETSP0733-20121128/7069_1 /TAXON_ID=186038 /ORGANISM="Fragilariopsis kerguelensis, Strain L26-C5" /LENGTH=374 /DNA_ID=CAMNT_0011111217 /DNA_START=29 /DNA_END=1150 /DNA_ORIENTATION=-